MCRGTLQTVIEVALMLSAMKAERIIMPVFVGRIRTVLALYTLYAPMVENG